MRDVGVQACERQAVINLRRGKRIDFLLHVRKRIQSQVQMQKLCAGEGVTVASFLEDVATHHVREMNKKRVDSWISQIPLINCKLFRDSKEEAKLEHVREEEKPAVVNNW